MSEQTKPTPPDAKSGESGVQGNGTAAPGTPVVPADPAESVDSAVPARGGRASFHAFDLIAFIRAKRALRGSVRLDALSRVSEAFPADAPADAGASLIEWTAEGSIRREVRKEGQGRQDAHLSTVSHTVSQPYLAMQLRGQTWLECQRCMQAIAFPVEIDVSYKVMDSEAAADAIALDEGEAEVIVGSASFDLIDLIDEEIVLSMPMVPKHSVCPAVHASVVSGADGSLGVDDLEAVDARIAGAEADDLPEVPGDAAQPKADLGRPHPFAGLADLRKQMAADAGASDDDEAGGPSGHH